MIKKNKVIKVWVYNWKNGSLSICAERPEKGEAQRYNCEITPMMLVPIIKDKDYCPLCKADLPSKTK